MFGEDIGFSAEMVRVVQFFILALSVIGFTVLITVMRKTSDAKREKEERDRRLKREREARLYNVSLKKRNDVSDASVSETSYSMTIEEKLSALERLSKLKEQGILSDAELQAEKNKIIG